MSVFVNYDGPSLGKKQQRLVRSRAMVVVRGQQKQAKATAELAPSSDAITRL